MSEERKKLEQKLQTKFFVVGGGAWQQLWEKQDQQQIGFNPETSGEDYEPDETDLKSSIRPELLKRFRRRVLIMNPMTKEDYELLIPRFAECLPAMLQDRFSALCHADLEMAIQEKLGMRYFEEILTQVICTKPESKNQIVTK